MELLGAGRLAEVTLMLFTVTFAYASCEGAHMNAAQVRTPLTRSIGAHMLTSRCRMEEALGALPVGSAHRVAKREVDEAGVAVERLSPTKPVVAYANRVVTPSRRARKEPGQPRNSASPGGAQAASIACS